MSVAGSCHCGAVRFTIAEAPTELYTCDCSICSKRNALMAKVHESQLSIVSGQDKLTEYRWNTKVGRHFFCSICGIYTFHRKRSGPDHFGVNALCLDGFDARSLPVAAASGREMSVADPSPRPEWQGPRGF